MKKQRSIQFSQKAKLENNSKGMKWLQEQATVEYLALHMLGILD